MADALDGCEDESRFARQMRDTCCDESGKETNPAKAAEILHQIGLIYRNRSPDKIALIKSAGLLNAAIVRNPTNVSQIKSDLSELCRHILEISNANNQTADLIGKSEQVKISVTKLRNNVKIFLESKVPKISTISSETKRINKCQMKTNAIQELNKLIAHRYKQAMAELSQYCEQVMGKAPCQYAIVGMGSLAREEITPYSDFEHVILLHDDKNFLLYLEYFKWFSVIFHIVVLNVQETIVPSLNIASLNGDESSLGNWFYDDVTPRGISFDGMMPHACKFPLGRQQHTKNKHFTTELIKPVSEMLEYLSSEADLKHGYHLADILTKTCFVFGNEDIFKQFVNGAQNYRDTKSQTDTINDITKQVKQDLNNFSTRFRLSNLKSQHTINIKQLVYRSTTIFISALARKHNISANSCFDIIEEMAKNKQITQNTAEKLKFVIAIACEMRLRVYMDKNSQCDNAIDLTQDGIEKFLDIVGAECTINYFQIAYCLQCEVAKQLNFTKLHFYTDSQLINITIGLAFGMTDLTSFSKDSQKHNWDLSKFDFDACIEQLESKMKLRGPKTNRGFWQKTFQNMSSMFRKAPAGSFNQTDLNLQQIKSVAKYLDSAKIFDEALEFYKQLLNIYESKSIDNNRDYEVALANHRIVACLLELNEPEEALSYSRRALEVEQKLSQDVDGDRDVAYRLHDIGRCHTDLHKYDDALTNLNRALEIFQNTTLNADTDRDVANTLHTIAWYHINLHNYDEALTNLYRALEIKQNSTLNADADRSVAITLHTISECHLCLHNYDEALTNLNRALEIVQNTARNADTDRSVAATHYTIGRCLIHLNNYDEALTNLNRALDIKQNMSLDVDKDRSLAATQQNIGRCLIGLQQYDDSWNCLQHSLKILQSTTLDEKKDISIAHIFDYMGECLIRKQQYAEALIYLRKARKIYQTQINWEKDLDLATALNNMGVCLMELEEYADALNCFKESLQIYEKFSSNEHIAKKVSSIRCKIDECSLKFSRLAIRTHIK